MAVDYEFNAENAPQLEHRHVYAPLSQADVAVKVEVGAFAREVMKRFGGQVAAMRRVCVAGDV